MMKKIKSIPQVYLIIAIIFTLLFTTGCLGSQTEAPTSPISDQTQQLTVKPESPVEVTMESNAIRIDANSQYTYKNLKIATGNFWNEEVEISTGEKYSGITAGLWIFVENKPQEDLTLRVYPGQVVECGGHEIKVIAIIQNNDEEYIEIEILK